MAELREPAEPFWGHAGPVRAVAYSPDGTTLTTTGSDGTARVWDARTGEHQRTLTGHTDWVRAVAYSPDGTTLTTTSDDGTARVWNPRTGRQVAGTGFGTARSMRPLAGVRSDEPSSEDLLAVADDVETLATLTAAVGTEPPLAIALLGDWGSGKSSVMRQMQDRVQSLADLSLNNLGLSSFASSVRQVSFNAWHYSDDHVWTGLIEHLFRELARPAEGGTADLDAGAVRDERCRLADRLAAFRERDRQLSSDLRRSDRARPRGLARSVGSPRAAGRLLVAAGREILRDGTTYARLLLVWSLIAAVLVGVHSGLHVEIENWVKAVAALSAPVLVIWRRLRALHREQGSLVSRARQELQRRREEVRRDAIETEARLAEVDAAVRLAGFLTDRASPDSYQEYRGLPGHVHRDLRRLDDDLRAARAQWQAVPPSTPPLERIVLYIDDLDRCPPQRVVEVLAAVHLMLALPLFVVVVAVDPRWLLGSLRHHYHELFTAAATDDGEPDGLATPLDYLDKIFQIPFAVPPLTGAAASAYVAALLDPPGGTPPPDACAAPADVTPPGHEAQPQPAPAGDGSRPTGDPPAADEPAVPAAGPVPGGDDLHEQRPSRRPSRAPDHEGTGSSPLVDLRPESLILDAAEIRFLAALGPLLPTPRAVKKLVNLYRLLRIGVPAAGLPAYLADRTYQPVQVLLALLVGAPRDARTILAAILDAPADRTLVDLLRADDAPDGGPAWEAVAATRRRLADLLDTLGPDLAEAVVAGYQTWTPRIARYSFHTRCLTKPR